MSQLELALDNSASSNALRLYVSLVRSSLEKSNISVQVTSQNDNAGAQLNVSASFKLFGASTIAQYIDRQITSSGASIVSRPTAIENCQLSQLISLCQRDLSVKVDSASHLEYFNKIVLANTFFVGLTLSLADLFLFSYLHAHIKSSRTVAKYQALLRWFDFMQHTLPIDGLFDKVQPLPFNNKPFAFKALAPVAAVEQQAKGGAALAAQATPANNKKGGDDKKADTKKAPAAASGDQKPAEVSPSILDMRIGRVLSVKKHEAAEKLLIEEIDVGEEQPRTICSGLVGKIAMEDILGKDVLVMCNLKPSNMVGVASNGMVVCSTDKQSGAVELVKIPENSYKVGERIVVDGHEGEPAPANQVSKKLSKILPLFSTNDKGEVVFNGTHRFKTQSGAILFSQYKGAEVK